MHDYRQALHMLRDAPFALLLAARTLAMLAIAFAPVALAFGILDLPGATPSTLSVVLASEAIVLVLFTLVGGVVADRLPRPRVLMTAESVNAAAHAALAAMLVTGTAPTWGLAVAAAVSGAGSAMVWPALTGIIPDVVAPERLQQGNALISLGGNIARVGGLVAGGAVVVAIGGGWALATAAAMFAVAGVLTGLLGRRMSTQAAHAEGRPAAGAVAAGGAVAPPAQEPAKASVFADLKGGWNEFRSRQWLWVVVLQFSFMVLVWQAAHGVLGPVVAKQELGGARAWTAVLTGEALGLVLGVIVAMRIRPRRPILVGTLLTFGAAPPYVLLGVGAPLWSVVAAAFVMGVCFDMFGILWQTTLQRSVPAEALSRVSSYDALGSLMLGPIGLMLAGPAAMWFGPHAALVACGIVMTLTTVAALCAPGVRQLTAPPLTPTVTPTRTPPQADPAVLG
jgi:MFS family permease